MRKGTEEFQNIFLYLALREQGNLVRVESEL